MSLGADAQSSVTLYGTVDSGLFYQSMTADGAGKAFGALDGGWSSSFWGITGAEGLGNGYDMRFKLESGLSTVSGNFGNSNGNLFGRNAYVGLSTPFGEIRAGLQYSPFILSVDYADPRSFSQFASGLLPYLNYFGAIGMFDSNSLVYNSPPIGGLSGSVQYAFGNVSGAFAAGRRMSGSLNYSHGSLDATAAYFEAKGASTDEASFRGINFGVGYRFGGIVTKLAYTNYRNPVSEAALTNVDVYEAGAQWDISSFFVVDGGVYISRDRHVRSNKSNLFGVGAQYFLSKRTMLYVQIGIVHNEGAMATSLAATAAEFDTPPPGTTAGVNFGIRQAF